MLKLTVILLLCVSTIFALNCDVKATISLRLGSAWQQPDGHYQLFDITITNNGSCIYKHVYVTLALPDGSMITNAWNYDTATKEVINFGHLAPGQSSTSAGIVAKNANAAPQAPIIADSSAICDEACPTSAPSTSAPTNAPTSAPTPTNAPTSAPTSSPIDTKCKVTVSQTRRVGASWTSGPSAFQIYDLTFTNTGSETVLSAQVSFGLYVGYPSAWWGLSKVCCTQVRSTIEFGLNITEPMNVGSSVTAGYVLEFDASRNLVDPTFDPEVVQTEFAKWVTCQQ